MDKFLYKRTVIKMMKPMLSDMELKVLVDNKLEEDLVLPLLINNNIIELHKADKNGFYKIRVSNLSKKDFKKVFRDGSYYSLTDWMMIDGKSALKIIVDARKYLEDLFFDI